MKPSLFFDGGGKFFLSSKEQKRNELACGQLEISWDRQTINPKIRGKTVGQKTRKEKEKKHGHHPRLSPSKQ